MRKIKVIEQDITLKCKDLHLAQPLLGDIQRITLPEFIFEISDSVYEESVECYGYLKLSDETLAAAVKKFIERKYKELGRVWVIITTAPWDTPDNIEWEESE